MISHFIPSRRVNKFSFQFYALAPSIDLRYQEARFLLRMFYIHNKCGIFAIPFHSHRNA